MCGLAGIISLKNRKEIGGHVDIATLNDMTINIQENGLFSCKEKELSFRDHYLGGKKLLNTFWQSVRYLKKDNQFIEIFTNESALNDISKLTLALSRIIDREVNVFSDQMGILDSQDVDLISEHLEALKDIAWCLEKEIRDNVKKIKALISQPIGAPANINIFKNINAVLNSMDRLEVRGRDSAGVSLLFVLDPHTFEAFRNALDKANLLDSLKKRSENEVLVNRGISIHGTAVSFTYKTAAEIGSLGDNVAFLREQIRADDIFQIIVNFPHTYHTVLTHTRWASVGAISEPNCHPVDNKAVGTLKWENFNSNGIIHVCLNGDIDNYLELKQDYEQNRGLIPKDITTDTKIIPLQIEKYICEGHEVTEAFRLAVNDFQGSHAICMHTDLDPGKFFIAQKGSGQAVFIGLAEDHYLPASEVYGFVEETSDYLKVEGEKIVEGKNGRTQGQIFVLSQESGGGLSGVRAMYYDGTPVELGEKNIKHTAITSRDIDRQGFSHYFLKEISESPVSVEKTLQNRWKVSEENPSQYVVALDEKTFPKSLEKALAENQIRRVFFVGQGTAGVAAQACADILTHYMNDPALLIRSLKASELSGFKLSEQDGPRAMEDTLVVAISQSGTTTDTNRTVDMVRERGAHTLGIVNRRDSDLTFKVDGVIYTSSGRDIEMSVASTKAFYSQIVAGTILSLHMAYLKGNRTGEFVTEEIRHLQNLPDHMRKILAMREPIGESAKRIAVTRTYWAAVGSGPNKTSADEIRIKLSELCYKTISSDYVEDKKHIDLSSEPLILICAAGTRDTVIGDIIKDTAIFRAHKALPVVIADEGEQRFDSYAESIFYVPVVPEHLAPVVNTLVGHIWGYYAALAINEGSRFLYTFRENIQKDIENYAQKGLDVYELVLEKSFREKIARFYNEFRKKIAEKRLPLAMGADSDLTLLLKYLAGRLPLSDFELDFGVKGTPLNMINTLFERMGRAINDMARPVDAIKHQAKTVTVGTSRISEKTEGILFEVLAARNFRVSQLTAANIIVLKNLQGIVSGVQGLTLYKISGLNLLGEPTDETVVEVLEKEGTSKNIRSRAEKDNVLKGTKKIIVREGNVYIGKGRKDDRSILIIPILSTSSAAPNIIEYLLLLNVTFKENIPLSVKTKALGGKYERIKNIVQENSIPWEDKLLECIDVQELFGVSAEKVGEYIGSCVEAR
jgi:glucosamine--fructose-6-phosphate aminotransferase (isomerizing)